MAATPPAEAVFALPPLEPSPPSTPTRREQQDPRALASSIEAAVRALQEQGQEATFLRGGRVVLLPLLKPPVHVLQGQAALRYHDNPRTADCVLILQPRGVRVFACSEYLMQRSDFFKAMLSHGAFKEAATRCLSVQLPCPAQADATLRFLYTGGPLHPGSACVENPAGLFGLLENANYLQSHELTAAALAALRARLRESGTAGEAFFVAAIAHPAFQPNLIPLEWIACFVRCTPERSTTERVRAALAWTRGADLEEPATRATLSPLRSALEARIAATSAGEVGALMRESGAELLILISLNAAVVPVLERAAADTRAVLGRQRALRSALVRARQALASMETLTAFHRCERCRVHVPMYLAGDASCTQTYHSGRYYTFNETTRRGGWTCCGATSKTVRGCRGHDCPHRFAEGAEEFVGLVRGSLPPVVGVDDGGSAADDDTGIMEGEEADGDGEGGEGEAGVMDGLRGVEMQLAALQAMLTGRIVFASPNARNNNA